MNKYLRPYCEKCKLIWGNQSIGRVFKCTKCNRSLVLETFNPWPKVILGVGIICSGGLTLFVKEIPIIWVGGFLYGASLMINGLKQWSKIKELDDAKIGVKKETGNDDANYEIINCGSCSTKIQALKGRGIIKIRCPKCSGEYRVMT